MKFDTVNADKDSSLSNTMLLKMLLRKYISSIPQPIIGFPMEWRHSKLLNFDSIE